MRKLESLRSLAAEHTTTMETKILSTTQAQAEMHQQMRDMLSTVTALGQLASETYKMMQEFAQDATHQLRDSRTVQEKQIHQMIEQRRMVASEIATLRADLAAQIGPELRMQMSPSLEAIHTAAAALTRSRTTMEKTQKSLRVTAVKTEVQQRFYLSVIAVSIAIVCAVHIFHWLSR